MNQKLWQIILIALLAFSMVSMVVVLAQETDTDQPMGYSVTAQTAYTYTNVITVTSAADPDDRADYTCSRDITGPPIPAPDGLCTLRRAIVEATEMIESDPLTRPVLISFDIPTSDDQYNGTGGYWVIQITDTEDSLLPTLGSTAIDKSGQVIIDGETQPDYDSLRPNDPRIIIRGHEDDNLNGLVVNGNNNIIRGLAFQNFRNAMQINHSNNIIEDNWFGFTADGQEPYLRNEDDPMEGTGAQGIVVADASDYNLIQNNIFLGLDGPSIEIGGGDDNQVLSNTVGASANGTIPEVRANRKCRPNARYYNWFGGGGFYIGGSRNQVENNRLVGMLYYSIDPFSTPEDAIVASGEDHIIQNNIIGIDANDQSFGVCGEGIHVGGAFGGHYVQVVTNTIVGSHGTAGILITGGELGYDINAVTVRNNIIEDSLDEAFAFGEKLPSSLREFNSAAVTAINGASVSGTSGANSPCAYCTIELFLDKIDTVTETLESLDIVTADGNGNWTATLPRTLVITEGIRTASTTASDGQIPHPSPPYSYDAGTTAKLSKLYVQTGAPDPTPAPSPALEPPPVIPEITYKPAPTAPTTFNRVITVTSAADPDDSESYVCYDPENILSTKTPQSPCTLRRALVEADSLMDADPSIRPILIRFTIPDTDTQYIDEVWVIQLHDTASLNALPTLGSTDINKSGQVVIDGTTQTGYSDSPLIVIRGPQNRDLTGLVVNGDNNAIRGLTFQKLRTALQINHSRNVIEDNWFGLTADGQGIYLRDESYPEEGSGAAGIILAAASDNNLIQDNVLTGLTGEAINMQGGDDNHVLNNYIGTRANGTIDLASVDQNNICVPTATTNNWFGGEGINVSGLRNQIVDNVIAGLLIQGSALQTPPNGINVTGGQDNLIQNNRIGRDAAGTDVWVCGSGIDSSARFTYMISNLIVSSYQPGILIHGNYEFVNVNTIQENIISNTVTAIEFGDTVPDELALFMPARIMGFEGVDDRDLIGASGSDCPYCRVEVYLEDDDPWVEAPVYLGSTNADVNGDWDFTLPAALEQGQGLRTTSTSRNYGVIPYFEAGSTTILSELYDPPQITEVITAGGGALSHTSGWGTTEIDVPSGAFAGDTTVTFSQVNSPTQSIGDLSFGGQAFDLDASSELQAGSSIVITMEYYEDDLTDLGITDEGSLVINYWTGSEWADVAGTCTPASTYTRDTVYNTVSVAVCHLSSFGLFKGEAGDNIVYLPLIVK